MAVKHVLFVHGYSETSLGAYSRFPSLLSRAGISVEPIVLSAFDSLDDQVSIADLAAALEDRIAKIEAHAASGWDTASSALICHSTGALVARRWMLDRAASGGGKALPSHLITMAGANHGSTLAQAGKSVLGYLQKLVFKHIGVVGARVLTDLDYGSDFLLALNRDWLVACNDASNPVSRCYAFSMGGDSIGDDPTMKIFWGTHEPGCDNTVRISGANLNYRLLDADQTASRATAALRALEPQRRVPHIVLHGYSHFGDASGILGKAADANDPAFRCVLDALAVDTDAAYANITANWDAATEAWSAQADPGDVNATVVFSIFDRGGRAVDDCMIAFLDAEHLTDVTDPLADKPAALAAMTSVNNAQAINAHSPIHNDVQRASYSFYLNWPKWKQIDHLVHVEAHSASPRVHYRDLDYPIPPEIGKLVRPNEYTYVRLQLERDTDDAYYLYGFSDDLQLASMTWGPGAPFPSQGRIPPDDSPEPPPAAQIDDIPVA